MAFRSERRFISYGKVTTGMMVEFSYTKETGDTNTYTAIVIDPSKSKEVNGVQQKYMHAILIDDLTDFEIIKLATELGEEFEFDPDNRTVPITYLKTDEAYTRYTQSNIKPKRIYRTFITERVKSIRQILLGEIT